VSRLCPLTLLKLTVGTALLLSALVLLSSAAFAQDNIQSFGGKTGAVVERSATETQPPREPVRAAPEERDRRVVAALLFTVIGTIGLITIGSVVLLTQPGDRQVMVAVEPADPSEEPASR
jgi:hypothetical protein